MDYAGNVSACSAAALSYYTDNTNPSAAIAAHPPAIDTNQGTFTFSSNEANVTFDCLLDGAAASCPSSPTTLSYLTPGPHRVQVRATDVAGNAGAYSPAYRWTVRQPAGHWVLIGHDYGATAGGATQALRNALGLAAAKVPGRAVRVAWFAANATAAERAGVTKVLNDYGAAFDAFTGIDALAATLPGHDVLLVSDQNGEIQGMVSLGRALRGPAEAFLENGGVLIVLDGTRAAGVPSDTAGVMIGAMLMGYSFATDVTGGTVVVSDAADPLAAGVGGYGAPAATTGLLGASETPALRFGDYGVAYHRPYTLFEDFEGTPWQGWLRWPGAIAGAQDPAAAHDGGNGLSGASGWHLKNGGVDTSAPGTELSLWVRFGAQATYAALGYGGSDTALFYGLAYFYQGQIYSWFGAIDSAGNNAGYSAQAALGPGSLNTWYLVKIRVIGPYDASLTVYDEYMNRIGATARGPCNIATSVCVPTAHFGPNAGLGTSASVQVDSLIAR